MKHLFFIIFTVLLTGCELIAQTPPQHKFTWINTDTSGTVMGYNLYCGQATGQYTQNANIIGEVNTTYPVVDMKLPDGKNYCVVAAYNFVGESAYSSEIAFYVQNGDAILSKPTAPSNLKVN